MIIRILVLIRGEDQEKTRQINMYNKRDTMSERISNYSAEQMLGTDRCKRLFGLEGVHRCDNCKKFRKDRELGDFICRHVRGYKEAPPHIKRCTECEGWRINNGIAGDFWCKHNKCQKRYWDSDQG